MNHVKQSILKYSSLWKWSFNTESKISTDHNEEEVTRRDEFFNFIVVREKLLDVIPVEKACQQWYRVQFICHNRLESRNIMQAAR